MGNVPRKADGRRVWAMVNRTFRTGYNRKRIRRVMQLHGLMLAPRVHRRHGRPHLGQGLAEAFIGTFKRDYLGDAELQDAETMLVQLGGWFEDYNSQAPHSALGMRSPAGYRAEQLTLTKLLSVSSTMGSTPGSWSVHGDCTGYQDESVVGAKSRCA